MKPTSEGGVLSYPRNPHRITCEKTLPTLQTYSSANSQPPLQPRRHQVHNFRPPSEPSAPCSLHTYHFGLPDDNKPGAAPFIFKKKCLSDSGCSRSIISKDILDHYGIKYEPNTLGERLLAAGGTPLHVNGRITLEGTFYTDKLGNKKSCYMDCLVSDSLYDEIIISWKDATTVGALKISEDFDIDPSVCLLSNQKLTPKTQTARDPRQALCEVHLPERHNLRPDHERGTNGHQPQRRS